MPLPGPGGGVVAIDGKMYDGRTRARAAAARARQAISVILRRSRIT